MASTVQKIENRNQNKKRNIEKNKNDLKRNQSVIEKKKYDVNRLKTCRQTFLKNKKIEIE